MGSTFKKCRVCGKEYEACRSANRGASVFRWQEVACSPACGSVYLKRINESRNHSDVSKNTRHKKPTIQPIIKTDEAKNEAVANIEFENGLN